MYRVEPELGKAGGSEMLLPTWLSSRPSSLFHISPAVMRREMSVLIGPDFFLEFY